jgi:MoxR-like ATPase
MTKEDPAALVRGYQEDLAKLRENIGKVIVGQGDIVDGVLTCLFAGGHVLLEGVPGLGKTKLVRTLAEALSLDFSRIQFTPDLMPSDIIGTNVLAEGASGAHRVEFRKGPVFANVVLADEINRATPKTQSALLEAMQESSVTIAGETHILPAPYVVLATQNPLEMEGTYPLPEAQLDRFLLKLEVPFPTRAELMSILDRTTGAHDGTVTRTLDAKRILAMRGLVREVEVAPHVREYVVRLLEATHPSRADSPEDVKRFVRYGASPRGAQAMMLAAKVRALGAGRFAASPDDVRWAVKPALRHRVILGFEGEAEAVKVDTLLDRVLERVPEVVR